MKMFYWSALDYLSSFFLDLGIKLGDFEDRKAEKLLQLHSEGYGLAYLFHRAATKICTQIPDRYYEALENSR